MPGVLPVLQGIAAAAGLISSLKNILEGDGLNEKLDDILAELRAVKYILILGILDIMEAIDGIRRQIDEDTASNAIALADRALLSDLVRFNSAKQAMGNSFQAADRLLQEIDVGFGSSFMYVVTIRMAIVKEFDTKFSKDQGFQDEFQHYLDHLNEWIAELNRRIRESHTVAIKLVFGDQPIGGQGVLRFWQGTHLRNKVIVASFQGPVNDISQAAMQDVQRRAEASRRDGIERDRQGFGVVAMEETMAAWAQAFAAGPKRPRPPSVGGRATSSGGR
jgi:hypothetical protein